MRNHRIRIIERIHLRSGINKWEKNIIVTRWHSLVKRRRWVVEKRNNENIQRTFEKRKNEKRGTQRDDDNEKNTLDYTGLF